MPFARTLLVPLLWAGACGGPAERVPEGATRTVVEDPRAATLAFAATRPLHEQPLDAGDPPRDATGAPMDLRAESCGACHADALAQWRTSTHAHAWVDPQLQAEMTKGDHRWMCANCHTPLLRQQAVWPVALTDDDVGRPVLVDNPAHDAALQREGVTCAACHVRAGAIVGTREVSVGAAPHAVRGDPTFATAQMCARCHQAEAEYPARGLACAFTTVAEWAASPAAARGVQCQGCHMATIAGAPSHAFAGSGLAKVAGHRPEAQPPPTLRAEWGACAGTPTPARGVRIALTNDHAGHPVPAGDPERRLVVTTTFLDARGAVLAALDDAWGQVWEWSPVPRRLRDDRIAPGATVTACHPAPAGATRATVTLARHRMDPAAARYHGLEDYPLSAEVTRMEVAP